MPANEASAWLQTLEGVLQVAMADCSSSDHKRAVGNRFGDGFEFFSFGQQVRGSHCGSSILKGHIVGIHHPQMEKSKITHCPSGSADVERIAGVHQNHAQMIEFSGNRQATNILRHGLSQSSWQIGRLLSDFREQASRRSRHWLPAVNVKILSNLSSYAENGRKRCKLHVVAD
jgi:hypothetical protein